MTHYYYIFWVFKNKPNCFYHAKHTTELPPEEFIPNIDMTDIEEFFIKDYTTEQDLYFSYGLCSAHRKAGFLPMRRKHNV